MLKLDYEYLKRSLVVFFVENNKINEMINKIKVTSVFYSILDIKGVYFNLHRLKCHLVFVNTCILKIQK